MGTTGLHHSYTHIGRVFLINPEELAAVGYKDSSTYRPSVTPTGGKETMSALRMIPEPESIELQRIVTRMLMHLNFSLGESATVVASVFNERRTYPPITYPNQDYSLTRVIVRYEQGRPLAKLTIKRSIRLTLLNKKLRRLETLESCCWFAEGELPKGIFNERGNTGFYCTDIQDEYIIARHQGFLRKKHPMSTEDLVDKEPEMNREIIVKAHIPANDKWNKMKAAWEACLVAGVPVPSAITDFFGSNAPARSDVKEASVDLTNRLLVEREEQEPSDAPVTFRLSVHDIPKGAGLITISLPAEKP